MLGIPVVRDKLPCFLPVMSDSALIDAGRAVRMTSSKARFSSLNTCESERMDVNHILGSDGLGLISPLAIAKTRSRIFSCGAMPISDFLMRLGTVCFF